MITLSNQSRAIWVMKIHGYSELSFRLFPLGFEWSLSSFLALLHGTLKLSDLYIIIHTPSLLCYMLSLISSIQHWFQSLLEFSFTVCPSLDFKHLTMLYFTLISSLTNVTPALSELYTCLLLVLDLLPHVISTRSDFPLKFTAPHHTGKISSDAPTPQKELSHSLLLVTGAHL